MKITVRSADGKLETIVVTPEHPFLTPAATWHTISRFKIGDKIASSKGTPVTITAIKGDASERDVYNLTVKGDHSYAVGELGVWSHNAFPKGFPSPSLWPTKGVGKQIFGKEYKKARNRASYVNGKLRKQWQVPRNCEIHEIVPVKFGGSPDDLNNKIVLDILEHRAISAWFTGLQKGTRSLD